jgi:putative methionine-R-sulfoxide reductase with GAF domain
MADFTKIDLWLGTFEGEKFVWKKLNTFENFDKAYNAYKKFIKEQLEYTDQELLKIWKSPRLDIELKQGDKLINWVGIYCRKKSKLELEKEDEDDSEKQDDGVDEKEKGE